MNKGLPSYFIINLTMISRFLTSPIWVLQIGFVKKFCGRSTYTFCVYPIFILTLIFISPKQSLAYGMVV